MSKKLNPKMNFRDEETRANIETVRNLLEELQRDPNPDSLGVVRDVTYNTARDQLLENLRAETDSLKKRYEAKLKKLTSDLKKRHELNVISISQVALPSLEQMRPSSHLSNAGVSTLSAVEAPKSNRVVYVGADDLPISMKNREFVIFRSQEESNIKGFDDDETPTTSSRATYRSQASTSKEGIPSTTHSLKVSTSQVNKPKEAASDLMTLCNAAIDEEILSKTRLLGEPYEVFKSESTSRRLELYTAGIKKWDFPNLKNETATKPRIISYRNGNPSTSRVLKKSPSWAQNNKNASSSQLNRWDQCKAELSACGLKFPSSSQRLDKPTSRPYNSNNRNQSNSGGIEEYASGLCTYGYETPSIPSFQDSFADSIASYRNKNENPSTSMEEHCSGMCCDDELPSTSRRSGERTVKISRPSATKNQNLSSKRRFELSPHECLTVDIRPMPSLDIESDLEAEPLICHVDPNDLFDLFPSEPKVKKT